MSVAKRLLISGRVQGVFFRDSTRHKARELGVVGWVRNLPDGRVEAIVQGSEPAVERLVSWCRHGPPMARVDHLEVTDESPLPDRQSFEVRF